jgi:hypothetical protein
LRLRARRTAWLREQERAAVGLDEFVADGDVAIIWIFINLHDVPAEEDTGDGVTRPVFGFTMR